MKHPFDPHAATRFALLSDALRDNPRVDRFDRFAASIASGILAAGATMLTLWIVAPELSIAAPGRALFAWAPFVAWFAGGTAAYCALGVGRAQGRR